MGRKARDRRIGKAKKKPRPSRYPARPTTKKPNGERFRRVHEAAIAAEHVRIRDKAKRVKKKLRALGKPKKRKTRKARRVAALKGVLTRYGRSRRHVDPTVAELHGRNRSDWFVLSEMRKARHKSWVAFYEDLQELGWDDRDIYDEWFSPEE